nr:hypothetical protein GCM10017745_49450 [Saccharothrix mutabilis subsp. capreolus]
MVGGLADQLLDVPGLAEAFDQLSPRWQFVVVQVDLHGTSPEALGAALGVAPGAAVALSYHAHERLRLAYLRWLEPALAPECVAYSARLGAWVRRRLPRSERSAVQAHLLECERCARTTQALTRVAQRWGRPAAGSRIEATPARRRRWWRRPRRLRS